MSDFNLDIRYWLPELKLKSHSSINFGRSDVYICDRDWENVATWEKKSKNLRVFSNTEVCFNL